MIRLGITASSLFIAPDPDAEAYFAAMVVQPDNARKALITELFKSLKSASLWTKIDWLMLLASHTSQAALLNAKAPTKTASAVGSPTFTVDRGFTGDGSGTKYLSSGEVLNASGNVYALNSAFLYGYLNQSNSGGGQSFLVGVNPAGNAAILTAPAGSAGMRVNTGTTNSIATAVDTGGYIASRTSSTASALYRNGSLLTSVATASTSVPGGNASALVGLGMPNPGRIAAWAYGSGMNATEAQNFDTLMTVYLTAVGAN